MERPTMEMIQKMSKSKRIAKILVGLKSVCICGHEGQAFLAQWLTLNEVIRIMLIYPEHVPTTEQLRHDEGWLFSQCCPSEEQKIVMVIRAVMGTEASPIVDRVFVQGLVDKCIEVGEERAANKERERAAEAATAQT